MNPLTEQGLVAGMLADETPDPRPGRPPIVLQPELAAKALRELGSGHSYGGVARRCRRTKSWLIAVHRDGRLQKMAEGRWEQPTGP